MHKGDIQKLKSLLISEFEINGLRVIGKILCLDMGYGHA